MSTTQQAPEIASFPHIPLPSFPNIPQIALINCDDTKPEFIKEFGTVADIFFDLLKNYLSSLLSLPVAQFADGNLQGEENTMKVEDVLKTNGISLNPLEWFGFHRFDAQKGQLPELSGSTKYDCIILSGSSSSANDPDQWIRDLSDLIRDAVIHHPNIKLVGVCFGHQLLSKIIYPDTHVAKSVWEVGPYTVNLNNTGSSLFGGARAVNLEMFHMDAVFTPQLNAYLEALHNQIVAKISAMNLVDGYSCDHGFTLLPALTPTVWGSTEATKVQGTVVFDPIKGKKGERYARVLTMQGHPEMTAPMARKLLELFSGDPSGKEGIPADVAAEAKKRMDSFNGILDWVRVTKAIWTVASGSKFN